MGEAMGVSTDAVGPQIQMAQGSVAGESGAERGGALVPESVVGEPQRANLFMIYAEMEGWRPERSSKRKPIEFIKRRSAYTAR
jgi:hypothetical protein